MKRFGKPIVAFFLFLLFQIIATVICVAIGSALGMGTDVGQLMRNPTIIISGVALSAVMSICFMVWPMKMFSFKRDLTPRGIGRKNIVISIVALILCTVSTNILIGILEIPDIIGDKMGDMMLSAIGALTISIIGPIGEEVVFRGAMLGYLLRKNVSPWVAILFSSLMFGIMHMNPTQVVFASIIGVLLGVVYYKTGNILLSSLLHVLNNSVATFANYASQGEDKTKTLSEELGSTGVVVATIASIVMLALCAWLLYRFWKRLPNIDYKEVSVSKEADAVLEANQPDSAE